MRKTIATLTAFATLALAPSAHAVWGENFRAIPINGGPGSGTLDVPALPGAEDYLYAGTCDAGAAPPPGSDLAPLGGAGSMPFTATAPEKGFGGTLIHDVPLLGGPPHCIDFRIGAESLSVQPHNIWEPPPAWRLPSDSRAGGHPDGTAAFAFVPDGDVDNIYVDIPAGFVGNPNAVTKCTAEQFAVYPLGCPPSSQVGVINLNIVAGPLGGENFRIATTVATHPVYNLEPRQGNAAELGIARVTLDGAITVRLVAKARTDGDFGVTTFVGQIPAAALPVVQQTITLWGVPWAAQHDVYRAPVDISWGTTGCNFQPGVGNSTSHIIPPGGLTPACQEQYDPSWGPVRPFISNATECTGQALATNLSADVYTFPGRWTPDGSVGKELGPRSGNPDPSDPNWKQYAFGAPPIHDCEELGFDPAITLDPKLAGGAENRATDTPAGLDVELAIPQNNELPIATPPEGAPQEDIDQYLEDAAGYWRSNAGLATAHLRDTVVTLPEGMTLNPAAASGQGVCTTQQIGLTTTTSAEPPAIRFDNSPIQCPESSKVGEVVVETPLLDPADWPEGSVYLAKQGDNPFGSDFAIYIGVESPERGVIAKLAGKVEPDLNTGRLTTTFAQNPQLPFGKFRLRFKAGPRAPLATPQTCGTHTNVSSLTPYSDPAGPRVVNDPFPIDSSPAGGCPATPAQRPFALGFAAGSTELVAGAHSPFTVRLTRPDGNQEFDSIHVSTPEGLTAKLAGVPYCPDAAIAQAAARTATGDGTLEQSNPSCPAASQVGTTTIGAGAGSQPFFVGGKVYLAGPYKGAPISLAFIVPAVAGPFDLGVQVVRTALHVNPVTAQVTAASDTIPKILRGVPLRLRDIRVDIDRPGFTLNPTDCSAQLVTGKVFGASGAATDVSNRFQIAECARLGFKPKLNLRLKGGTKRTAYQGLRAVVTARPGDANIGRAAVTMPRSAFLAQEHIKTVCTRVQFAADACPKGSIYGKATAWSPLLDEPLTGNVYLRSSNNNLPDLVTDLRGPAHQPIKVELSGRTDSVKGALRNTFDIVPDAPVSRFVLQLFGGKRGLIVNSQNLCAGKHRATVRLTGQNGRTHNFRPPVRNSCTKKQIRKAKAQQKKRKAQQRAKRAKQRR